MISLIYGHDFHIFHPSGSFKHDDYFYRILLRQCQNFGPFPYSYTEIADERRLDTLIKVINEAPKERYFKYATLEEISASDKAFVLRIMKLDPRDRPTAGELLQDVWFDENEQSGALNPTTLIEEKPLLYYNKDQKT